MDEDEEMEPGQITPGQALAGIATIGAFGAVASGVVGALGGTLVARMLGYPGRTGAVLGGASAFAVTAARSVPIGLAVHKAVKEDQEANGI